jgi:competence protein ComEA
VGKTTVNPSERRALVLLLACLLGATAIDLILAQHPGWVARVLGEAHLHDLLAAGREEPPVRIGPAPDRPPGAGQEKAQPRPRIDRKLPYDEEGRLDLNRADSSDLVLLKGVGPVLAGRILEHRRRLGGFGGTGDLLGVRGIGPKTLAKLLPQITLGVVRDSLVATGQDS